MRCPFLRFGAARLIVIGLLAIIAMQVDSMLAVFGTLGSVYLSCAPLFDLPKSIQLGDQSRRSECSLVAPNE
jgi:hypothetical protein